MEPFHTTAFTAAAKGPLAVVIQGVQVTPSDEYAMVVPDVVGCPTANVNEGAVRFTDTALLLKLTGPALVMLPTPVRLLVFIVTFL